MDELINSKEKEKKIYLLMFSLKEVLKEKHIYQKPSSKTDYTS